MTSCKPPPTCIDASPIPDANDSRMSAIPYEANLTPMHDHPLARAPATLADLGSRSGAEPARAVADRYWRASLLLRPAQPLAARHERERQRAAAAVLPQGH